MTCEHEDFAAFVDVNRIDAGEGAGLEALMVDVHVHCVGNDLTATLMWCEQHNEPVWLFTDESFQCPQSFVVGGDTGDHRIVPPPWETASA